MNIFLMISVQKRFSWIKFCGLLGKFCCCSQTDKIHEIFNPKHFRLYIIIHVLYLDFIMANILLICKQH